MSRCAQLLGKWPLWAMSIGHCAGNYCFYFLLAWLPLYLVQERGFTITEMTLLATLGYAVQAVCAFALRPFLGPVDALGPVGGRDAGAG